LELVSLHLVPLLVLGEHGFHLRLLLLHPLGLFLHLLFNLLFVGVDLG